MSIQDHLTDLLQSDIQSAIEEVLCVEAGSAAHITKHIFSHLRKRWGGQKIYIPAPDNTDRKKIIRAAFNGQDNHAEVCNKFGISLSTLYRMLKK